jgi:hypothetical protein
MKSRSSYERKSYAMQRMGRAIDRAIASRTLVDKDKAAKWAAAWGMVCGIKSRKVGLKRSRDVLETA